MKKVMVLILCISMMVGLTACNNSNDDKDGKDKVEETKVSQEIGEEKETDETEDEKETKKTETEETEEVVENSGVELSSTDRIAITPDFVLNMDFPSEYMPIEQGYVQMFNVGRDKSISLVTDRKYEPSSLQDAHDAVFEEYIIGFSAYADIETLTAEKEETIDINGRETYHFEGKLNCRFDETEYNLYCTGYSFIMDGVPCMLIGTVLEWEKDQEMIDEVKMYTDAMIQTVREAE